MPEICSFNGMSIKIIHWDHLPRHVHVMIGSSNAKITFTGEVIKGNIPHDKLRILKEWLVKRQVELNNLWESAQKGLPLERIEP